LARPQARPVDAVLYLAHQCFQCGGITVLGGLYMGQMVVRHWAIHNIPSLSF